MQYIGKLLIVFFLLSNQNTNSQTVCGVSWPPENDRTDTITTYIFTNNNLSVSRIPDVKTKSNFSFNHKKYQLVWMPIKTSDPDTFIKRSLRDVDSGEIEDTFACNIFGEEHVALLFQSRSKFIFWIYKKKGEYQDIFIAVINKRKQANEVLSMLSRTLQE